jgi:hypothetical protein
MHERRLKMKQAATVRVAEVKTVYLRNSQVFTAENQWRSGEIFAWSKNFGRGTVRLQYQKKRKDRQPKLTVQTKNAFL